MTEIESLELLRGEMDKQGMTDNDLRAGTAAIAMGESALNPHTETGYGRTANGRIRMVFGSRVADLSDDELNALKANEEDFFNRVYGDLWGSRNLGNTQDGDGFRFRGRTVLQLTGRGNYNKLKELTGYDVVDNPDLANQPNVSAAIAVAYMRWRYKGGGWEAMKRAVGNNTPDIDARKNGFYHRFKDSGEMNMKAAPGIIHPPAPAPVVVPNTDAEIAEFRGAVRRMQTFLKGKGFYKGEVDGDFGEGSRGALIAYLKDR